MHKRDTPGDELDEEEGEPGEEEDNGGVASDEDAGGDPAAEAARAAGLAPDAALLD